MELRVLALAGGIGAGCVPFAAPPATIDVALSHRDVGIRQTGVHAGLGISPAQLVPELRHRPWDATLYAAIDHFDRTSWGAALAAGPVLHPWGDSPDASSTKRLMPELVGRLTQDGSGVGLRTTIESAGFLSGGSLSGDHAIITGYGEAAIGAYIEADYERYDGMPQWSIMAGLTLRVPALAGIVCCVDGR